MHGGKMESMIVFGIPEPTVAWVDYSGPGNTTNIWLVFWPSEDDILEAHAEEVGEWAW